MGRPKLSKKKVRIAKVNFRMTAGLRKALEKQAKHEGKSLSGYITDILEKSVERGE